MNKPKKKYVTKSGRILTSADFERLADEAERSKSVPKKRTQIKREPMVVIAIRMPLTLARDVERWAEAEETSVSEIVRDALNRREHAK